MKVEQKDAHWLIEVDTQEILDQKTWLALRFQLLSSRWKEESRFLSLAKQMSQLPSYQAIIEMGAEVLPFIFAEMQTQPHHWFIALRHLTNENPVKPESKGNIQKMTNDWLEWAKKQQII